MKSFFLRLIGFCAGIVVGRSITGGRKQGTKNGSSSQDATPRLPQHPIPQDDAVPSSSAVSAPPHDEAWFRKQMKAYEDALLAYIISKICLEMNVSVSKTLELYKQYGRVPLQPALTEYEAGFREQGLTIATLGNLAVKWLKEQDVAATVDTWEKMAAALLENRQKTKAEAIVDEIASK